MERTFIFSKMTNDIKCNLFVVTSVVNGARSKSSKVANEINACGNIGVRHKAARCFAGCRDLFCYNIVALRRLRFNIRARFPVWISHGQAYPLERRPFGLREFVPHLHSHPDNGDSRGAEKETSYHFRQPFI